MEGTKEYKVLVTGGLGFIGSNFIRRAIKLNYKVINLDKITYAANKANLSDIDDKDNYLFYEGDICDEFLVDSILEKESPDWIVNFAAESHVDNSLVNPDIFLNTNIFGTYTLLKSATNYYFNKRKKSKEKFKFLQISTDEVFGDLGNSSKQFTEKSNYAPSSPYSASKASADHLVRSWGRTYDLPYQITNCSNNYGPFQHPEKFIPKVIINSLNDKKIPIYGDGNQMRDWLYVEDHVAALLKVLHKAENSETFCIGGSEVLSNLQLVQLIHKIMKDKFPKIVETKKLSNLISFVEDRPGHDIKYSIDSTKIKKLFGWEEKNSIYSGLEKTISWYKSNVSWWSGIDSSYKNK